MEPDLEELKEKYLALCTATGSRPRPCLERYTAEHLTYFISILEAMNSKKAAD